MDTIEPNRQHTRFSSRSRIVFVAIGIIVCLGISWRIRAAQTAARISNAYGRLSQMRYALENYEQQHGTLPPLNLLDRDGQPVMSWRGLILPALDTDLFKQLDPSQPWDSEHNRKIVDSIPLNDWGWFARDRAENRSPAVTHIMAYLGPNSFWDAKTGRPAGTIEKFANKVLLISVPQSRIEPLQPGDITEAEIRQFINDGEDVLFILAGGRYTYGTVTIENDKLAFHTWQEELDRKEGKR
jgi:hypothetical protein